MSIRGEVRIDPSTIAPAEPQDEVELVVPYVGPALTGAVLARAATLATGLSARVLLVAVHTVPYPSDFECPTAVHAFLVRQLLDLAAACPMPVEAQVVLARSRQEGLRHALKPESTVLVGARKRIWRTEEASLARSLARDGHHVALLRIQ